MGAALLEIAVHMGMELYPGDTEARRRFVDWYIKTNRGKDLGEYHIIPQTTLIQPITYSRGL